MRLTASGRCDRGVVHVRVGVGARSEFHCCCISICRPKIICWTRIISRGCVPKRNVGVDGHLVSVERYAFYPTRLTNLISNAPRTCAHVQRVAALQVWQCESTLPITSIGGSDHLKQYLVFRNWHELTVTLRPSIRREIKSKHSDFAYIWLTHKLSSSTG